MRLRIQSGVIAAALAAALAGCATTPDAGMDKDKKYTTVCTEEAPTGSHISRLRCHRQMDADQRQERDRAAMEKMRHDTARPKNIVNGSTPIGGGSQRLVFAPNSGTSYSPSRARAR